MPDDDRPRDRADSGPAFEVGRVYRRRDLHDQFGGSYQSGISASRQAPVVFLFTGETGERHGYRDGPQPDGTFHYSGEGQLGDMTFTRGNLAIRAHHDDGRALHLFRREGRGMVRYVGQMAYADHRMEDGVPDGTGQPRRAIIFVLRPSDAPPPPIDLVPLDRYEGQFPPPTPIEATLAAAARARRAAEDGADYDASPPLPTVLDSRTVLAIRTMVLRRAGATCEGCGASAPFHRVDGSPYLEAHDTRRPSDHEFDDPAHVIALCPNCHRRVHHGEDGSAWDEVLRGRLVDIASRRQEARRPGDPGPGLEPRAQGRR